MVSKKTKEWSKKTVFSRHHGETIFDERLLSIGISKFKRRLCVFQFFFYFQMKKCFFVSAFFRLSIFFLLSNEKAFFRFSVFSFERENMFFQDKKGFKKKIQIKIQIKKMAFRFFLCFFLFKLFKVSKKRNLFSGSVLFFLVWLCFFAQNVFFLWFCDILFFSNRRKADKKEKPTFLKIQRNSKKPQIQQLPNKKILNVSSQIKCSQIEEAFRIFL
jgi:hypothetical protein